jgi:ABC-type Fe3+-hydroxamate transport system substrate-binding protein
MGRFKKDWCQISPELMEEIQRDANHARNMANAEKFFNNFDQKINKVGELLDKVPNNATVKPSRSWLNIFGIE